MLFPSVVSVDSPFIVFVQMFLLKSFSSLLGQSTSNENLIIDRNTLLETLT